METANNLAFGLMKTTIIKKQKQQKNNADLKETIKKAQNNNHKEQTVIYNKYYKILLGHMTYQFQKDNAFIIEDAVQESFIKVFSPKYTFKTEQQFYSFLFLTAKNTVIDIKRKKKNKNTINFNDIEVNEDENLSFINTIKDENSSAIESMELEERKVLIKILVKKHLSTFEQEVLYMRYYAGMKYGEIASELNKPLGTIKNAIFLINKKLSKTNVKQLIK